jgi:hypothetical protein
MLVNFGERQPLFGTVTLMVTSNKYDVFRSVSGYFQNQSDRLHTAGVGGSNPLPPTRNIKKLGYVAA